MDKQKEEWIKVHQPYEFKFHQSNNFRWSEKFMEFWDLCYGGFMELSKDQFTDDQILLDIGCGSRPGLDWFTSGKCYHLDPLLDKYVTIPQMAPYWKDKDEEVMLSQPAEDMVEDLRGKCDFVVCHNVLDHAYDWRTILSNMSAYCKKGAIVCFSTDLHSHGIGHPGIDNHQEFFDLIKEDYEIVKDDPNRWGREVFYYLIKK
jgi:SAM-dependent methyltransferase